MVEMAGNEGVISPEDQAKIVASATDYIQSWIDGDAHRMARCLHPELAKRSVRADPLNSGCIVRTLTRAEMVAATADGEGKDDAGPYEISIQDAYGDVATVRVLSAAYMDYVHIARCGEAWLILNVLFQPRAGR
jgi:putative lumazine-binding protein